MTQLHAALRWVASADGVFSPFWKGAVLLLTAISVLCVIPAPWSWNDQSRMAAIESIVERGTLVIDKSRFVSTGDKIYVNGHFYSDKTPFSSLIGAVVYLPLHALGLGLGLGWSKAYYCITLFTVKAFWLLSLLAFHGTLRGIHDNREANIMHTLCFGFASLHLSWSSVYNNHSLAASMIAIAFYFYMRSRHAGRPARDVLASGLLFALAGNIDVPTAAFYAVFLVLIGMDGARRKFVPHFLIPAVLLAIPAMAMNYSITGSVGLLQINKSYFDYPGSPWGGEEKLSGIDLNTFPFAFEYAIQCLFGRNGFLIHNPILFVLIPCLAASLRRPSPLRREWVGVAAASVTIMAYYFIYTSNFGGASYSIRWFVPLLPLLFLGGHAFFKEYTERKKWVLTPLFLVSFWISVTGMTNPWAMSRWYPVPLMDGLVEALRTIF